MKDFMMKHPIISCCMFNNILGALVTIVGLVTNDDNSRVSYDLGLFNVVKRRCKEINEAVSNIKTKAKETETEETEDEVTE